jgi:hypothetical protein
MSQLNEIIYDIINKKGPFDDLMEFINESNLGHVDLVTIDGVLDLLEMREKALHSMKQKMHLLKKEKYMEYMLQKIHHMQD